MEINEVMNNEEVIEDAAEVIAEESSRKGFMIAAGIGLVILGGLAAYKYIGKPFVAKMKKRKEQAEEVPTVVDSEKIVDIADEEETEE